jgi:hypothetical protein
MAYTFSVNNTPNTGATAIYLLLQTLVLGGWEVLASGDGLSTYSNTGLPISGNILTGAVGRIQIINGGSGYVSPPTVVFNGGGGSGATATAYIVGGVVTCIIVETSGSNYTSAPTMVLTGGGGSNATAQAFLNAVPGATGLQNGNAWFRIQQPGTQKREFTFQICNTADIYYAWRVKYSPGTAGGFINAPTGGGSVGPSTTPSASDEVILTNTGSPSTDNSPNFQDILGSDNGYHFHISVGDASVGYCFNYISFTIGTLNLSSALALEIMQTGSHSAADQDPAVVYGPNFASSSIYGLDLRSGSQTHGFFSSITGANPPSTASGSTWYPCVVATIGNIFPNSNSNGVNSWIIKDDVVFMPWYKSTAPYNTLKGWGAMLYMDAVGGGDYGSGRNNGDLISLISTNDRLYVNGTLLPWAGIPILI